MARKLYRVTVELDYYALAESEQEAMDCADDAVRDICLSDYANPFEVDTDRLVMFCQGWDEKCLVYGPSEDTTLAEAINIANEDSHAAGREG